MPLATPSGPTLRLKPDDKRYECCRQEFVDILRLNPMSNGVALTLLTSAEFHSRSPEKRTERPGQCINRPCEAIYASRV